MQNVDYMEETILETESLSLISGLFWHSLPLWSSVDEITMKYHSEFDKT